MEGNKSIGEYPFKVLPFEVDFREKLTLPHLTNYILNSAGYHADSLGFGIENVKVNNQSWVVSRLAIEINEYPKNGEKIKVQTWVENVLRMFSMRNFAFLTQDGEPLGYARSAWALIDKTNRRPTDLSKIISSDIFGNQPCPIAKVGKIPATEADVFETFTVKYSDVDFNQHLNSSKYIEHIIDSFTLYKFSKRDIKRFEIEYISECLFGEKISIHKKEDENGIFILELKNETGATICKSKVIFGEQTLNEEYIIK